MKGVKRVPVLRYGLIVLLITMLFSGAFYLYLHYNNAQQLQTNISKLITARENSELIDSCLLDLYTADNNSRLYVLTGDKKYVKEFSNQINGLNALLGKIREISSASGSVDPDRLKKLIIEKTAKTNDYIKLRLLTDSLIKSTSKLDSQMATTRVRVAVPAVKTIKTTVHIDTVKPNKAAIAEVVPEKKPFGRIFSAFSGKKGVSTTLPADVIIKTDTLTQTVVKAATLVSAGAKASTANHKKLDNANRKLRINERDILLINNNMIISIISDLKKYKTIELAYAAESKKQLAGRVTDVFNEYSNLAKITTIALIGLIIVVLYNIWKIFSNGRELIEYSEKAEEYANNKSNFMASMSHEIRTPLNSVIGFSEQLAMSNLSAEQTVQINAIMSSSHMLLDVVNEILDFSKYETGKMAFEQQPFMTRKALEEVYDTVSIQAAKKGISLKQNIDIGGEVCFTGDMLRLKQVVMNLMVNAIKFTPVGEVTLFANLISEAPGTALLKVRVKDSGIGIKKKNLPLIFNEFAQVSDAQKVTRHKGTGLGLAICKKIVELQGGKIKVASEPGKGSVFSFELPFLLADKNTCAVEQPIAETEMSRHVKGINVLLAEDNQLNVLLAKTILKKWHINCDVANNGQEALDLFEEKSYDIVLSDIQMPVMGGMELLAKIRSTGNILKAETPVIVLTANVLKEDRDKYKRAGANDIVLKPFAERNLIEKISLTMKNKFNDNSSFLMDYQDQTLL